MATGSKLARARASMQRLRQRYKAGEPTRALSAFGAGVAVGSLERTGVLPPAILSVPAKPVLASALLLLGANSPGGSLASSLLMGAGDGVLGAYGYQAAKQGTLIAGMDEVEEEGEEEEEEIEA